MEMTIREFIENYEGGAYDCPDVDTMIAAGWYDWFCRDTSLKGKLDRLFKKVKLIAKSGKVDQDRMYVFFKNNCPCYGSLYDDFRICEMGSGDVVYTIIPSSGHERTKGQAELWGRENGFEKPIVAGTWRDVRAYFEV